MRLDSSLLREFAKITNDTPEKKKESTVYGTVKRQGSDYFVQLDGSDILTPVAMAMDAEDGDRVTVMIKDHTAVITGNITSPASARKNTYIKTIDDTLLLYGLDAVGIRSETEVGNSTYRAEVVVNTEDADDPLVQIQTYKVGDSTKQNILRVSLDNGALYNGGEVITANAYCAVGTVTLKGGASGIYAGLQKTATISNIPSGYRVISVMMKSFTDSPYGNFEHVCASASGTNQVTISYDHRNSGSSTFTAIVQWVALKITNTIDGGSEIIDLPT